MIEIICGLIIIAAGLMLYIIMRLRHRLEVNKHILNMSLQLSSTVDRRQLLSLIMDNTNKILHAEASSIILMDQESGDLYFEVATGDAAEEIKRIHLPAGQGVAGWVQIHGQSVIINDVTKDERWSSKVSDASSLKTRNMLCVPIASNGALLGVVQVINKKNKNKFNKNELHLLEQLSSPIAMSLENMMLYEALRHSMDSLSKTTAAKEKMHSEMKLAKEIQLNMLPGHTFKYHNISLEATLLPAREVGGDFYHFFKLDDEHILICLGDVSDKGMPAALFMSALMIWIKAKATSHVSVEEIVYAINQELSSDTSTMFATLFIAIINSKTGEMSFCDAGHCNVYIINSNINKVETIKDLPIGVMPHIPYHMGTYQLKNNDQLLLYTDGITEAENSKGEWFGEARFEHYLNDHLEKIDISMLINHVKDFADAPQSDDIAIMKILFNDDEK